MNLKYERKDKEDCNNGGKSVPAYLHKYSTHLFHSCLPITYLPAKLVAIKKITPQSINPHPKQSTVMTKRRQGVASEIITSSPVQEEKTAKKIRKDEEIKKK